MLYLYGILRTEHRAPVQHLLGQRQREVWIVESGPLAAAVSEFADGSPITEDDARAHLHVLVGLVRHGPVLPLRLGTVADDEAEVRRDVLDANAAEFTAKLNALEGVIELQVGVDDDETDSLATVTNAAAVRRGSATDLGALVDLGQEVAGALMEHRQQLADEVVGRLRHLSVDDVARAQIRGPEDPVLRWAFLVRREDLPLFDEAIAALRAEYPALAFQYVGPLPAAHFVDRIEVAAHQATDTFRGSGSWGW